VRLALLLLVVACERERDTQPAPPPPPPPVPPPSPSTLDCALATPAMPAASRTLIGIVEAAQPGRDVPDSAVDALVAWDRSGAALPIGCSFDRMVLQELFYFGRAALVKAAEGDGDAEHAALRLGAELRAPDNFGDAIALGLDLANDRRYLGVPPGTAARTFAPGADVPFLSERNNLRCRLAEKSRLDADAFDRELLLVFDGHGNQITKFAPDDKQQLLDERRQSMGMTITPNWYADEVPTVRRFLADTCARLLDTRDVAALRKLETELERAMRHPTSMLVRLVGGGIAMIKGDIYLEQHTKDVAAYRAWLGP
jgi:hypothetical protein